MSTFYYKYNLTLKLANTNVMRKLITQLDGIYFNNSTNPSLKWVMLSAHDTNLLVHMPFLNLSSSDCQFERYFNGSTSALNCNNYTTFASNIIIEMLQNDTTAQFYIRIRYNGRYQYLCEKKETECLYSEFRQRVLDNTYGEKEFEELCKAPESSASNHPRT